VRRKPKENNFRSLLDTIRALMLDEKCCVPAWLHDVFLGYGDPAAAMYYGLQGNAAADERDAAAAAAGGVKGKGKAAKADAGLNDGENAQRAAAALPSLRFNDTFVDYAHLQSSFNEALSFAVGGASALVTFICFLCALRAHILRPNANFGHNVKPPVITSRPI
jgi:hypothetical protein